MEQFDQIEVPISEELTGEEAKPPTGDKQVCLQPGGSTWSAGCIGILTVVSCWAVALALAVVYVMEGLPSSPLTPSDINMTSLNITDLNVTHSNASHAHVRNAVRHVRHVR